MVENLISMWETRVWSLGREDRSPGEGTGTHSSIFAWRIPWIGEPGRPWGCKKLDMIGQLHDVMMIIYTVISARKMSFYFLILKLAEKWWAAIYGVAQSRTRLKQLGSITIYIYARLVIFLCQLFFICRLHITFFHRSDDLLKHTNNFLCLLSTFLKAYNFRIFAGILAHHFSFSLIPILMIKHPFTTLVASELILSFLLTW